MTSPRDNLHESLERIFHEPNRLAIMSALCGSYAGLTFNALKETCGLTDGNLNRHLKVLEDSGAVAIEKSFVASKPRTTVRLSDTGVERFNQYIETLSEVVEQARRSLPTTASTAISALAHPQPVKG